MHIETLRTYCLSRSGTTEEFPFDEHTLVFKVGGKMFAATNIQEFERVNLKCDPERAIELREQHPEGIIPGYHMSKKHWNTVYCDGQVDDKLIQELIDHSYELVVKSLPKKVREDL